MQIEEPLWRREGGGVLVGPWPPYDPKLCILALHILTKFYSISTIWPLLSSIVALYGLFGLIFGSATAIIT